MSRFGTKNALFGYFGARILKKILSHLKFGVWKQYCHIWNQHPRIVLIGKFREIMKMLMFGNENA